MITLENKIQQLSQGNGAHLGGLLQKLRDGNAAELQRYQRETEASLSKTLGALKNQMDQDARAKEAMSREKDGLEQQIRQLSAKCNDLEGQVNLQLEMYLHVYLVTSFVAILYRKEVLHYLKNISCN